MIIVKIKQTLEQNECHVSTHFYRPRSRIGGLRLGITIHGGALLFDVNGLVFAPMSPLISASSISMLFMNTEILSLVSESSRRPPMHDQDP